jgi:hypothetical protein
MANYHYPRAPRGFSSNLNHTNRSCAKNSTSNIQNRKRVCESVIGLFMGREVAWIVGDLHCRIRSDVTAAKAIEHFTPARCYEARQNRFRLPDGK